LNLIVLFCFPVVCRNSFLSEHLSVYQPNCCSLSANPTVAELMPRVSRFMWHLCWNEYWRTYFLWIRSVWPSAETNPGELLEHQLVKYVYPKWRPTHQISLIFSLLPLCQLPGMVPKNMLNKTTIIYYNYLLSML
jgi:hypothetical protein